MPQIAALCGCGGEESPLGRRNSGALIKTSPQPSHHPPHQPRRQDKSRAAAEEADTYGGALAGQLSGQSLASSPAAANRVARSQARGRLTRRSRGVGNASIRRPPLAGGRPPMWSAIPPPACAREVDAQAWRLPQRRRQHNVTSRQTPVSLVPPWSQHPTTRQCRDTWLMTDDACLHNIHWCS